MPTPETTVLVAAANLLRTEAVGRIEKCREALTRTDADAEAILESLGHDLGVAVAASKAADGIDDVLAEIASEEIRG